MEERIYTEEFDAPTPLGSNSLTRRTRSGFAGGSNRPSITRLQHMMARKPASPWIRQGRCFKRAPMINSAMSPRYYAIDGLRGTMMLAVVSIHAALPYIAVLKVPTFHDTYTSPIFDLLALFVLSFALQLFLIVAGFSGALLCTKHGVRGFVRNRCQRILLPLIGAWLVLSPLTQGAYQFANAAALSHSVILGFDALRQGSWIRWNEPNHLWFLIVLLAFYLFGLFLRWCFLCLKESSQTKLVEMARRYLISIWRPVTLTFIVAGVGTLSLICSYYVKSGNVVFISNHVFARTFLPATLPVYFVLGWVLYSQKDLLPNLRQYGWTYVVIGFATWPIAGWTSWASTLASPDRGPAIHFIFAYTFTFMSVCMVFGLLGLFLAYYNRPNPIIQYLSEASYWIYIVQLPLVVFIGGMLSTLALPAVLKWIATLTIAIPIFLLTYHIWIRFGMIGALINGRRLPRYREPDPM